MNSLSFREDYSIRNIQGDDIEGLAKVLADSFVNFEPLTKALNATYVEMYEHFVEEINSHLPMAMSYELCCSLQ